MSGWYRVDEYFDDFAKAYREEIQELYSLGCRLFLFRWHLFNELIASMIGQIQLDDPWLCFYCDENIRANIFKAGKSADEHVATFVRALNACMDETQDDITVAIHLCRSSFNEVSSTDVTCWEAYLNCLLGCRFLRLACRKNLHSAQCKHFLCEIQSLTIVDRREILIMRGLQLEFHDPNLTGDFDSLKHFPSSKRLVLGLLSAKEDLEVVNRFLMRRFC